MNSNKYSLGIDTSNYKTSVAVTDSEGSIIFDGRKFLTVDKGARGLRQQEALFQHINNLPELIEEAFRAMEGTAPAYISASSKPRPLEGSYMPVFNAGVSAASVISAALSVKPSFFSHQEGHLEAVKYYSELKDKTDFAAFHFSGGTTEALIISPNGIEVIGGSKDISFGQLLDRIGVALGFDFPCGEELDKIAATAVNFTKSEQNKIKSIMPAIKCRDAAINLSGIETAALRVIESKSYSSEELIIAVFLRIADAISAMMNDIKHKYACDTFLVSGGVSSSLTIRNIIKTGSSEHKIIWGEPNLSSDNAVGIALLGGRHNGA